MHKLQTVPQKEPDIPPEELAIMDESNSTPTNLTGKKLRLVPSSASSNAQTGNMSPSKGIYIEGAGNTVETRGEDG